MDSKRLTRALVALAVIAGAAPVARADDLRRIAPTGVGPRLSTDGRFVVFETWVPLVAEDRNDASDVYVYDVSVGSTTRVSVSSAGGQGNGPSGLPDISGDGRFVVFHSEASNLVDLDTNGVADVFRHDTLTGTTERVSERPGFEGNGESMAPRISADGTRVVFGSWADNLVSSPPDVNSGPDLFLWDASAGSITRVSPSPLDPSSPTDDCVWLMDPLWGLISGDGSVVVFGSPCQLVPADTNSQVELYRYDVSSGALSTVQGSVGISPARCVSHLGDGIAFESMVQNVPEDTNGVQDLYVTDQAGTHLVSVTPSGAASAFGLSNIFHGCTFSADGRYLAFDSQLDDLVSPGTTRQRTHAYVRDLVLGRTRLLSTTTAGAEADASSETPTLSGDGKTVAFFSWASNLVEPDPTAESDLYLVRLAFLVNSTGDAGDANTTDVGCDTGGSNSAGLPECTLRAALQQANASPGPDLVTFSIPEADPGFAVATRTYTISPGSPLPASVDSLIVDGATGVDGRIVLDGASAGAGAAGLAVSAASATIASCVVRGFSGDGVSSTTGEPVTLRATDLLQNGGYGLRAAGDVYFNADLTRPGLAAMPGARSLVTGNGRLAGGGGIRSDAGAVIAGAVEVGDNAGPGIVAAGDMTLGDVRIAGNQGPGVQSLRGNVEVFATSSDHSEPVEIVDNEGPGIFSGTDPALPAAGAQSLPPGGNILVHTDARVDGNASWGIIAPGGSVVVNAVDPGTPGGVSELGSSLSGNGASLPTCAVIGPDGQLAQLGGACDGGGAAAGRELRVNYVEIAGNAGPGLFARDTITLRDVRVTGNGGPGVQSMHGDVLLDSRYSDHHEDDVIADNGGPGILAGEDPALPVAGASSLPPGGDVVLQTDVRVDGNASWGIVAPGGVVVVNGLDAATPGPVSDLPSSLSGNGASLPTCSVVGEDGLPTPLAAACDAGGAAAGGEMRANYLDIADNRGPGLFARDAIALRDVRISGNSGPGVQSMAGDVTLEPRYTDEREDQRVTGNGGPGILAGVDLEVPGSPGGDVTIQTAVDVSDNAAWGIAAPNGRLVLNAPDATTPGPVTLATSRVRRNGAPSALGCALVDETGLLAAQGAGGCDGGGLTAALGVVVYDADVTGNAGIGVATPGDLLFDTGTICFNAGGDLDVAGTTSLIEVAECPADEDADGVSGAVEAGAPNGGDGNLDGVPDAVQANVASLPSAAGPYVTVAVEASMRVAGVAAAPAPTRADAPEGVSFPYGLVGFRVLDVAPGGGASVTLDYPDAAALNTFWLYGPTADEPTPHWHEFLDDGELGAAVGARRATLRFRDGARGDGDLAQNGEILDPGGPGIDTLPRLSLRPSVADSPPAAGATRIGMLSLVAVAGPVEDVEVMSMEVAGSGDGDERALRSVQVWVDADGDGDVGEGEPLLGEGTFEADDGTVSIDLGPRPLAAGSAERWIVTYELPEGVGAAAAGLGRGLQGRRHGGTVAALALAALLGLVIRTYRGKRARGTCRAIPEAPASRWAVATAACAFLAAVAPACSPDEPPPGSTEQGPGGAGSFQASLVTVEVRARASQSPAAVSARLPLTGPARTVADR